MYKAEGFLGASIRRAHMPKESSHVCVVAAKMSETDSSSSKKHVQHQARGNEARPQSLTSFCGLKFF